MATSATSEICVLRRASSVGQVLLQRLRAQVAYAAEQVQLVGADAQRRAVLRGWSLPRRCRRGRPAARVAVPLPFAVTAGSVAASWMRYWARACVMLSTATRRSRLLSSARPDQVRSFASAKKVRQPTSAAGAPSAGVCGKRSGTGAAGRS